MSKYTNEERALVKSIVANLTIKRIPDNEIIKEVARQTNKTISRSGLRDVRQQIKRDSYKWYQTLRQGEYEFIHEFKERINEIMWLQKKHNEIIKNNPDNPTIQQTSLAELHKLNITLSNYYDVAPTILNLNIGSKNDNPIPNTQQDKEIIV
ncbi:MAG TPA: hypothetical protein VLD84_10385 [Nitrososphaeraceae archaeon]|nr:hypothetical protein [Nitrososphaeraceae archaeon]